MEESIHQTAFDIFVPVMESATVLAAHYAKACGRDVVLAEDMQLGLMYAARNVLGKQIGPLYPEVWDEDESGTDSDGDDSDQEDPEWVRYEGSDDMANKMNECADSWGSWVPESPAERALKDAVDKQLKN
jgi:hypothetical protein